MCEEMRAVIEQPTRELVRDAARGVPLLPASSRERALATMQAAAEVRVDSQPTAAPLPWRCAPCNAGRASAAPTPIIVAGIVALNYVPLVLFLLDQRVDGGRVTAVVIFHIFLLLMLLAYFMAMCTDPGTPPEEWQQQMAAAVSRGETVPVCRRSGLYKPPRSHYDSVTERLTLNMDHFCPWVVNTVGFYNRKFFMLFLVYTNLTLLVVLATLLSQLWESWDWLQSDTGARRHFFPGVVNTALYVGAMVLDGILLCVLVPFMHFHIYMARRNETTIEGYSNPKYDVGPVPNLRSVFGREAWTWPIPLYLHGPDGNGLHWPTQGDARTSSNVGTPQMSASRTQTSIPTQSTSSSAVAAEVL
mmetsp:Transcript_11928/g.30575  ORF Transcript_11928/g.30575 Transcript_11928/m.30575 type:complete len:360 (-) Transcript_11928:226-1305(-)